MNDDTVLSIHHHDNALHNSLVKWMRNHGFQMGTCHMKPANFSDTGRGLAVTKEIDIGDVLIDVPDSLIITSKTAMNSYLGESIKKSRLTPLGAICTFLVCERCRGAGSPWYPYVSTLPQSYTVPAYWPDELIHRLPSIIRETALSQKESVLTLYKRCRDILDNASHLCTDLHGITITLEQFIWAWSTVNTRCVYWRQNDDPNLEKDGEDHYALVPFLDLLNHAHNVQVTAAHNNDSQSYQIHTKTSYSVGQQVFINYGAHSNIRLLLEYGFILPDNPNNEINITDDEFSTAVKDVCNLSSNTLKIIHEHQLHRGHALSIEGLTWSLSTALKLAALEEHQLSNWRECMEEDFFISTEHKNTTNIITIKVLQLKMKQFNFKLQDRDNLVEKMIDILCQEHQQIIKNCLPNGCKLECLVDK